MVTASSTNVSASDSKPLLEMRGIHKYFPGVHALKGVSLSVDRGKIHAIVGENGAGKSTLMQILAGVYAPDKGSIHLDGRDEVALRDEREAQRAGIAMVFQERSLFGPLSVADNIFAGRQPCSNWGCIQRKVLYRKTRELLVRVGLDVPPEIAVERLSPAHQQLVEIAKGLSLEPKLILLDEPTTALSLRETLRLFDLIRQLRDEQVGILYISHHLNEVFELAEQVTVLKDGAGQGTYRTSELTKEQLVAKMIGRQSIQPSNEVNRAIDISDIQQSSDFPIHTGMVWSSSDRSQPTENFSAPNDNRSREETQARRSTRIPLLEVISLCDDSLRISGPRLLDVTFQANAGEILGIAGLVGAGRTELALTLFGARARGRGSIFLDGKSVAFSSPSQAIAAGIGYVPEDRKEGGLFLDMSIADNILSAAGKRVRGGWMRRGMQRKIVEELRGSLQITCRSIDEPVRNLSGGNQQKVVLARWLLASPKILMVDEPTRGVDIGAKTEIHLLLRRLADQGTALIVISSDLPEILSVSDRIIVMRAGKTVGELDRQHATEDGVMRLASIGERLIA